MTKIVAFAGRKQAGKSTAGNFLFGLNMWSILLEDGGPLISRFSIDEKGRLIIPVDFGPEKGIQDGIFDPNSKEPAVQLFLANQVWPAVKMYSFADGLKYVCIDLLGLSVEQCFGTNDQKNSPTNIIWKDVPGFPAKNQAKKRLTDLGFHLGEDWTPDSPMTARHVLQYVGTEIFRKMVPNVWVNDTIKRIQGEGSEVAIITDCRFENEANAVKEAGGVVIKLTRAPFAGQDEHASEKGLDNYTAFDDVIDNANMTIQQQNEAIFDSLKKLGVIEVNEQ